MHPASLFFDNPKGKASGAVIAAGSQFTLESVEIGLGLREHYSPPGSYVFNSALGG